MAFDFRQWWAEVQQGFRAPLKAIAWILVAVFVAVLGMIVVIVELGAVPDRLAWLVYVSPIAKLVLLGASTALFTRFMGGMGMFRDAISDVLGEDRWLDRRNDLEDLWRRITRRIFLPGFREDSDDAERLLAALNSSMTKVVRRREQQANHYLKDTKRRINIAWKDRERRVVSITDRMDFELVAFSSGEVCQYDMAFVPAAGETLDIYTISFTSLFVDGRRLDPAVALKPAVTDGKDRRVLPLQGKRSYKISRTMIFAQPIDSDPIYFCYASRVVWGMNAIITNNADGLRVDFEEVGVQDVFVPDHGGMSASEMEWDTRSVLLPNQGFLIVMATKPPSDV